MGSLELRASICLEMTRKVLGKGAKFGLAGGGAFFQENARPTSWAFNQP
jgi:hypothetical protein